MRVGGHLWLLLMLGVIQHGHRESAVSAIRAEADADSSIIITEDKEQREWKEMKIELEENLPKHKRIDEADGKSPKFPFPTVKDEDNSQKDKGPVLPGTVPLRLGDRKSVTLTLPPIRPDTKRGSGTRTQVTSTTTCHTVSGPDTGSLCIFPFILGGYAHLSCVDTNIGTACATQVDSSGALTNGGVCNDGCIPTVTRPDLCTQDLGLYMCGEDCIEKWKPCNGSCSHYDNLNLCGDICTESPCSSCHTVSGPDTGSPCTRSEVIFKKSSNLYCRFRFKRVLMVGTKVSKGFFV